MNDQLIIFIEEHLIAIVSTCDDQMPHGAPIFYCFDKEDNAFYFLTKNKTQKHLDIEKSRRASLTIFDEKKPAVFSASCEAEVLGFNSIDHKEQVQQLVAIHSSQDFYPTPISTLKSGELSLVKLTVKDCKLNSYETDIDLLRA